MSVLLVGAITVPLLIAPGLGRAMMDAALALVTGVFGWLYMWFAIAIFAVLVWLAVGRYGQVKFGDRDMRPEFSTLSWIAMIFTTGIGGGIIYKGVVE